MVRSDVSDEGAEPMAKVKGARAPMAPMQRDVGVAEVQYQEVGMDGCSCAQADAMGLAGITAAAAGGGRPASAAGD